MVEINLTAKKIGRVIVNVVLVRDILGDTGGAMCQYCHQVTPATPAVPNANIATGNPGRAKCQHCHWQPRQCQHCHQVTLATTAVSSANITTR